MKYLAAPLLAAMLGLSACTTPPTVANDVLAAEQSLATVERLALIYTTLPRCGGVARICSDPVTVQRIKDLDNQAYMAVKAAEQNSAMLSLAIAAISNFSSVVTATTHPGA